MSYNILHLVATLCVLTPVSNREEVQFISHNERAALIAAIHNHFSSEYVNIIVTANSQSWHNVEDLAKLERHLSTLAVPTATIDVEMIGTEDSSRSRRFRSRPLFVIFKEDKRINNLLREIAKKMQFSDATWLLFLEASSSLSAILVDVIIPFNCEFLVAVRGHDVTLTEVYHVSEGLPLQQHVFGSWSASGRLEAPRRGLYSRRSDLQGIQLRTVVREVSPVALLHLIGSEIRLGGFAGTVWDVLSDVMNFTSRHRTASDDVWGNKLENGSWNGMVGMLERQEADVIASGLTITTERAEAVDFTGAMYTSRIRIGIRELNHRPVSFVDYMSPFSPSLWSVVLVTILFSAVVLATITSCGPSDDHEGTSRGFLEALFVVFASVCQQGQSSTPTRASSRIVFILILVVGVVVVNSYSGFIISTITAFRPHLPFDSLEGLESDGSYALGVINTTFYFSVFKNARSGLLKRLHDKHMTDHGNLPVNYEQGFMKSCARRYGYISDENTLTPLYDHLPCRVVHLPQPFMRNVVVLPLQKNSPYVQIFSSNLLKLINNGVIARLYKIAFKKTVSRPDHDANLAVRSEEVAPILKLLFIGIISSVAVLCMEILVHCLGSSVLK